MSTQITHLAAAIKAETDNLQSLLSDAGIPSPTFALDAATELPRDAAIQSAQMAILEACTQLQDLVEGPVAHLMRITSPRINILGSLQAINQFKIAKKVLKNETVTYEELAKRCSIDVDDMRRVLRMAITYHIFHEPTEGSIAHTAWSLVLAENDMMSEWVGVVCDEMWPTCPHLASSMMQWPGSQEPGETAFAKINGGNDMWTVFKTEPARALRFAGVMHFLQTFPAMEKDHLISALAWRSDCDHSLVDIGGSLGSVAIGILQKYPNVRCCVQDLPEVVGHAKIPPELENRLEFAAHDFFTKQVVRADVYLLRSILHDWPDKYAISIIRNLIPALAPGAKIIINEVCLPGPHAGSFYNAQFLYGYDLAMKLNFNSKERSSGEWKSLFAQADPRFRLERIVSPFGSALSLIEFVWD